MSSFLNSRWAEGVDIVTHNARDFVGAEQFGIEVIPPRELLRLIGEAQ